MNLDFGVITLKSSKHNANASYFNLSRDRSERLPFRVRLKVNIIIYTHDKELNTTKTATQSETISYGMHEMKRKEKERKPSAMPCDVFIEA